MDDFTWRNSLKSAVVGGGDGEWTEKEQGDWRQLDDAGDKLELGVVVSQYLAEEMRIIQIAITPSFGVFILNKETPKLVH